MEKKRSIQVRNMDDRVTEMVERFSEEGVSTMIVDGETETDRRRKRARENGGSDRKKGKTRRRGGQV